MMASCRSRTCHPFPTLFGALPRTVSEVSFMLSTTQHFSVALAKLVPKCGYTQLSSMSVNVPHIRLVSFGLVDLVSLTHAFYVCARKGLCIFVAWVDYVPSRPKCLGRMYTQKSGQSHTCHKSPPSCEVDQACGRGSCVCVCV